MEYVFKEKQEKKRLKQDKCKPFLIHWGFHSYKYAWSQTATKISY